MERYTNEELLARLGDAMGERASSSEYLEFIESDPWKDIDSWLAWTVEYLTAMALALDPVTMPTEIARIQGKVEAYSLFRELPKLFKEEVDLDAIEEATENSEGE